jgi:hypothetical protein
MENSTFKHYWNSYGGFGSLLTSPYFWASIFISIILFPHWMFQTWWEDVLSIMPNVLGFSLGGYAILLAFGDSNFQALLSEKNNESEKDCSSQKSDSDETTIFTDINVTFVHFILLQILSIILAISCKAYFFMAIERPPFNFIEPYLDEIMYFAYAYYFVCYVVFIYAILSAIAATLAILETTRWYEDFVQRNAKDSDNDKPST